MEEVQQEEKQISTGKHSDIGILAVILGIISIICVFFIGGIIPLIIVILTLILGTKAYKAGDKLGLIAIILVVVAFVLAIILSAFVYLHISSQIQNLSEDKVPDIRFMATYTTNATMVTTTDSGLNWDQISVVNGTKPSGTIDPGDSITQCSGHVTITWIPKNKLLAQFWFT